jgi:hypothetical protein
MLDTITASLDFTGTLPMLLAQSATDVGGSADPAATAGASLGSLLFGAVIYVFFAFCQWKIFEKCGTENAWFAWIPVLSTYALFKTVNDENAVLWTILSIIPCVGIVSAVMAIVAWVKVFQKLDKSPWLLLLCLTGIGAFFVFGYAAFA